MGISFRSHGLEPPSPLCETASPVTNTYMVAEGIGVSNVPLATAREAEKKGGVRRIKLESPQPSAMLGLAYRTITANHPRIAALRSAIQQAGNLNRRLPFVSDATLATTTCCKTLISK
jgi:DNA-binding transcriptional LysR family regulator